MASFSLVGLGGGGGAATHKGLVGHGGGGDAATHKPVAGAHALHAAVADATRVSELAAGRIQAGFRGHVVRAELDSIHRRNMKEHGLRRLHIRRYTLCKPWRHAISVMLALDVWLKDDENVKVREKNDKKHVEDATKKNKVVFEVKNYEELRKVEMSKQGDESMYTMDALSKRRHCRIHPKVVNAINSWWDHFSENNDEGKEVVKCEAYAIMNMALDLVINHDAGLDDFEMVEIAGENFVDDAHGQLDLDRSLFFEAVFELADIWTPTIDPDHYEKFLGQLLGKVEDEISRNGQRLSKLAKVVVADVKSGKYDRSGSLVDKDGRKLTRGADGTLRYAETGNLVQKVQLARSTSLSWDHATKHLDPIHGPHKKLDASSGRWIDVMASNEDGDRLKARNGNLGDNGGRDSNGDDAQESWQPQNTGDLGPDPAVLPGTQLLRPFDENNFQKGPWKAGDAASSMDTLAGDLGPNGVVMSINHYGTPWRNSGAVQDESSIRWIPQGDGKNEEQKALEAIKGTSGQPNEMDRMIGAGHINLDPYVRPDVNWETDPDRQFLPGASKASRVHGARGKNANTSADTDVVVAFESKEFNLPDKLAEMAEQRAAKGPVIRAKKSDGRIQSARAKKNDKEHIILADVNETDVPPNYRPSIDPLINKVASPIVELMKEREMRRKMAKKAQENMIIALEPKALISDPAKKSAFKSSFYRSDANEESTSKFRRRIQSARLPNSSSRSSKKQMNSDEAAGALSARPHHVTPYQKRLEEEEGRRKALKLPPLNTPKKREYVDVLHPSRPTIVSDEVRLPPIDEGVYLREEINKAVNQARLETEEAARLKMEQMKQEMADREAAMMRRMEEVEAALIAMKAAQISR